MTAGADRLVSVDLHYRPAPGLLSTPFDHLTALPIITDYLRERIDGPTAVVSPDAGGVKRAERYARRLDATVAFVYKRREADQHNVFRRSRGVRRRGGRHAIIVDDMIDTAGTVTNAAELVGAQGALSVRIAATHAILSEPAVDRIKNSSVEEVIVTNTLPVSADVAAARQGQSAVDRLDRGRGPPCHLHREFGLRDLPGRQHLSGREDQNLSGEDEIGITRPDPISIGLHNPTPIGTNLCVRGWASVQLFEASPGEGPHVVTPFDDDFYVSVVRSHDDRSHDDWSHDDRSLRHRGWRWRVARTDRNIAGSDEFEQRQGSG